jgi:glycosyltransferase involved in cell wall biosynthesis
MRIAIDIRKIGKKSTGDETVFYYLIKELTKLKEAQRHQFLLLTDENADKAGKILAPLPANFSVRKITPAAKLFWTFYSLPRFLRKNSVDVLHVQYTVPFHLSKKIKVITTIHDVSFKVNPPWISKKDSLILNTTIPLSLKRADGVITVSQFSKEEIVKYYRYPSRKILVTHPAVDTRYFAYLSEEKAKKEVGKIVKGSFPFMLHLSSLQPRKNVPLIIAAFAALKRDYRSSESKWEDLKLVIVGNQRGRNYDKRIDEEIQKQVQNRNINIDDVVMAGYQPIEKLPCFYKAAEAFVFPSNYEGFGIPLLEAMACKTPVIASNIGSLEEVGGKAPVYIDLKDKERTIKLQRAIKKILENKTLRTDKIELGLKRVNKFSWKKLAKRTMKMYEKVVSHKL